MRTVPCRKYLSDAVRMHFDRQASVPLRQDGCARTFWWRRKCLRQRFLGRRGRSVRNSFRCQRLRRHTFPQSINSKIQNWLVLISFDLGSPFFGDYVIIWSLRHSANFPDHLGNERTLPAGLWPRSLLDGIVGHLQFCRADSFDDGPPARTSRPCCHCALGGRRLCIHLAGTRLSSFSFWAFLIKKLQFLFKGYFSQRNTRMDQLNRRPISDHFSPADGRS